MCDAVDVVHKTTTQHTLGFQINRENNSYRTYNDERNQKWRQEIAVAQWGKIKRPLENAVWSGLLAKQ